MSLKRITFSKDSYTSDVAIWEWNIESGAFSGTAGFLQLFEVPENSNPVFTKEELLQFVHPRQHNELCKKLEDVAKGETDNLLFESRFKKSGNDAYEWLSIKGSVSERDRHHKPIKVIGYCQSIEERKEVENQLKECEERWFNTMVLSGAGFWDYEIASDRLFFSIQMKKIIGYEQGDSLPIQGAFWRERIHPDDRAIVTALEDSEATRRGEKIAAEFRILNFRNEYVWVSINGICKFNEEDTPIRYSGFAYDITEKKLSEIARETQQRAAELSLQSKRRFLANVSHEIRTPLHAIVGLSDQLVDADLKPEQSVLIQIISQSSKALMNIINDLLDLSKMEEGKFHLDKLIFDPYDLIRQVYSLFADQASKKNIYFKLQVEHSGKNAFWGDPSRIRQIFSNIISNAIKFTEKGGVEISCCIADINKATTILTFTCKDTGIGMNEKMKQRIFEEFMQEDESFQRKFGGSGLGLAITNELVKLMHGNILVESHKNKGTLVTVSIPLSKITDPMEKIEETEEPVINYSRLKEVKLLVAEDNEFNRLLVKFILDKHKIQYDFAENGRVAIEKASNNNYNLILMDIQMPEMDGIEATRLIREQVGHHVPVVALTANAVKEDLDYYLQKGISGYLIKPFEEKKLLEIIHQFL
ncbi:MAG: response regulator [Bacteroidetes bacterium]|nr:response regulator [Bacteroidota bacterium]